ncbi:hypothetical protein PVAND_015010 [Polypedilum vanderplanki]|uniref:Carboxylic ester hydrolase n=1 Tax=Polypedilum vanderplanki TaxID=319348 RepID=A0A9J6BBE9_POLVA|nr:hypothetical protein PVAND_015010 [Polypedilum vanderplanki]
MKFLLIFIFAFNFIFDFSSARTSESLKVEIEDGKIIGGWMTSLSGKIIRAFMGIPYAAPPIGDLRFKAPQKVKPWGNVSLLAQKEPPMCTQINTFNDMYSETVYGQEDCLYLNVYTPEITKKITKKLPVLVWIHSGAWLVGHAGYTDYSPEYLLEHDIILVTGNYRLGALGFLSTEDEYSPGNYGFKDQLEILRWVKKNIEKFGGDANSVTLAGESAGAAAVNYHMFSPKSRGLFHRAISQSGHLFNPWADPAHKGKAKENAIRLAEKLHCSKSGISTKSLIECLRKISAEEITRVLRDLPVWDNDPLIAFQPVIENFDSNEEPFISELKYEKLSLDIPWIVGITSEEGLMKSASFFNNAEKLKELEENWKKILPVTFYYDHLPENEVDEINQKIYNFYFKESSFSNNKENLTNMWSEGWFGGFFDNLSYRFKSNDRENTFVYLFTHKGAASFSEYFLGEKEEFYGTCHVDEIFHLFPIQKYFPDYMSAMPTQEDRKITEIITKLWANFVTFGNPTPNYSEESKFPIWKPATKFPLDFMKIGNENGASEILLEMKKDLYPERANFWIELRKKYGLHLWAFDLNGRDEL